MALTRSRLELPDPTVGVALKQFLLQRIKTAAPGCDGITAPLLKNCAASLSSSLCHIFQRSISSGEIPADWKTAAVTPLYKDGPKEDVQNYRPISVTSLVGKVMERIVRDQLTEFLEANDIFPGSALGPLLFNVFIADLPKDISSGFEQYADDTTLWRVVTTPEDADALQNDLDRVYIWCENNGMLLNQRKSYAMDITRARTPLYFEYTVNGAPIEYVNKQRLLGVNISSNLRWDVHTDAVRAKAARVLNFAARNLLGCTQRVKRVAYLSLVKPILTFGLPAWHPTTQANTTKLERVQRRELRFIHGRRPPPPQEAKIMPVQMHLNYTDLNFFKKCEGGVLST
ncbi:Hypothetical predicted protein [Cloeon dipterum]|uniref:Reverse transcriptase domain-containing protein n=1 Tax=Cloeon dipterum TaxID=197152 RepID=A0A8S1D3T7_9INSE|nr:Hypothetical predicted protein [Cloeon dipterum]